MGSYQRRDSLRYPTQRRIISQIFRVVSRSVLAFSCSPTTQISPLSSLRISALRSASRRPTWTTSQIRRASVDSGIGRRYVSFKLRVTPPNEKSPGLETPCKMQVERVSTRVAAQPPWRLPSRLVMSGVTVKQYVTRAGGPLVADSKRTWERLKSTFHA